MLRKSQRGVARVEGPLSTVGCILSRHGKETSLPGLAAVGAKVFADVGDVVDGDVLRDVAVAVVAMQRWRLVVVADFDVRSTG